MISEHVKENRRQAFEHAKISVRLEGLIIPGICKSGWYQPEALNVTIGFQPLK
jgi:hypothetical protein